LTLALLLAKNRQQNRTSEDNRNTAFQSSSTGWYTEKFIIPRDWFPSIASWIHTTPSHCTSSTVWKKKWVPCFTRVYEVL